MILTNLSAQRYNFIRYDVKDGLSLIEISKVIPLEDGSILITTYGGGYNIYNGKKFKEINTTNGIANNNIYCAALQNEDVLWIGTQKGLSKVCGKKTKNYFVENGLPSESIRSLALDKDGILWIGTSKGLAKYYYNKIEKVENKYVAHADILSLFSDSKNNLWIGTRDYLIIYNYETKEYVKPQECNEIKEIRSISESKSGTIWAGTKTGLYEIKNKIIKHYGLNNGLSNSLILSTFVDSEDNLWIGTQEGLTFHKNNSFIKLGANEGLTDYSVSSIAQDREKNIWIGTDEGLYKMVDMSFKIYRGIYKKPLDAWSIVEKSKDEYLIGTELQGIVSLKNGKFSEIEFGHQNIKGMSILFFDKSKNLWIGTYEGVYRYPYNNYSNYSISYKNNGVITDIIQDKDNNIKFSTLIGGNIEFNGSSFRKLHNQNKDIPSMYFYLIDSEKRLWVGTSTGLEIITEDSTYVPKEFEWMKDYSILCMAEDSYGYIWAGSYEGGIFVFNSKSLKNIMFDTITVQDGLCNESIMGLTFDPKGNLWVSTNAGFNRISTKDYHNIGRKNILSYDINDGIPGIEAYQNGILTDSKGNIVIGTTDGVVIFDPLDVKENNVEPKIKFERIKILDRKFNEKYYSGEELDSLEKSVLELPYDENNLTIDFVGISLTNPKRVKYSYKIGNNNWTKPSNESKAYLSNLPFGNYTFEVKACNNNGVWSKNPAMLNIKLIAPFWKKVWFQITAVISFIGLVFLFYLLRLKRINMINEDLEERIQEKVKI